MQILSVLFYPGSAEADVGWGRKRNGHLIASCQEYVHQKLLKLDNSSSSYGKKNLVYVLCLIV